MSVYGCHDRAPYKPEQVLHGHDSLTGEAIVTVVPFRNSMPCNYQTTELGKKDQGCIGCKHRKSDATEARKAYMAAYNKANKLQISAVRRARLAPIKAAMQERINEALRAEVRREHKALNEVEDE